MIYPGEAILTIDDGMECNLCYFPDDLVHASRRLGQNTGVV